jgi:hypothetical protein
MRRPARAKRGRRAGPPPSLPALPAAPPRSAAMLDINLFREDKGGDPELVRESQRRRFADVGLVDKVLEYDAEWRQGGAIGGGTGGRGRARRAPDLIFPPSPPPVASPLRHGAGQEGVQRDQQENRGAQEGAAGARRDGGAAGGARRCARRRRRRRGAAPRCRGRRRAPIGGPPRRRRGLRARRPAPLRAGACMRDRLLPRPTRPTPRSRRPRPPPRPVPPALDAPARPSRTPPS